MNWDPEPAKRRMREQLNRNLDAAAIYVTDVIIDSFGDSSDLESADERNTRLARGRNSYATKQERAARRSKPWGPPNIDTGHLSRNIHWDRPEGREFIRRIGTNIGHALSVGYAMWLEFGTKKMLPRPFMRPGLWNAREMVKRILRRRLTK